MPLNYLLRRHQVSLMMASTATSPEARRAHEGLAAAYADRVEAMVTPLGATTARLTRA